MAAQYWLLQGIVIGGMMMKNNIDPMVCACCGGLEYYCLCAGLCVDCFCKKVEDNQDG